MNFEVLSEIAEVIPGTSPRGELINRNGLGLPFFQGSKEFDALYPKPERYTEHAVRTAKAGDILISVRAPVGEVNLTNNDVAIGRGVMSIRPKQLSERYFLFYYLKWLQGRWDSLGSSGSVFDNLSVASLKSIEVPRFEGSAAAGSALFSLDCKIEANKKLSQLLEETAQTIFKSWFIDFDPVKANMAGEKPVGMDDETAALFPDSLEDSELGAIPEGWTVKPLFDFQLEIESGSRPKGGVKGIVDGVPSIGAESINGIGVFDFSKTKYVSEEFFEKMNKGKPKDFDVLLYKDGGKPGEFKPRVGMFGRGFPFERYAINEHVFLLRSVELGPAFTYFWIRMERTLDVLRNRGIKAAIPGINQQDVGTLPVLWPNSQLIAKFTELSMPYLELILTLASESLELSRLRDSLLPRLISGELQIPKEMLVS
jgi:type I restriction enzyme S subunit